MREAEGGSGNLCLTLKKWLAIYLVLMSNSVENLWTQGRGLCW